MRKIFAFALTALMVSVMTPAASAEEVTAGYTVAIGGGTTSESTALIACLGPPEEEFCKAAGIDPIGGFDGRRTGGGTVFNAIATISDEAVGQSQTYFGLCVYTSDHSICGEDPGDVSSEGCGAALLLSVPTGITTANPVAGFVYTAVVADDLSMVCLGTTGAAVINYF